MIKSSLIYTDIKTLRLIKRQHYRNVALSVAVIIIVILLSVLFSGGETIFLGLNIAAMIWFLIIANHYRLKQKIALPEQGTFVSPIEGKVRSVSVSDDGVYIALTKSFFDVVEIRCPAIPYEVNKENLLSVNLPKGTIQCKFKGKKIIWFDIDNPEPGQVIGMMVGSGSCLIVVPNGFQTEVVDKQIVLAGETPLLITNN